MGKKSSEDKMIGKIREYMKIIGVRKAILFGSRAKGEHLDTSDVDLILISEKFTNLRFVERFYELHKKWHLPYYLEVLPFTPKEFRALSNRSIIKEAIESGIRINI